MRIRAAHVEVFHADAPECLGQLCPRLERGVLGDIGDVGKKTGEPRHGLAAVGRALGLGRQGPVRAFEAARLSPQTRLGWPGRP